MFTAGLGQPLASAVEVLKPTDLQTAMSYARAQEHAKEAELAALAASGRLYRARATLLAPVPPSAAAVVLAASVQPAAPSGPRHRFKRLTPEEMAEKRRNQECYFCKERYTSDHKCANKGSVFLLELDDDAEITEVEEELEISLHALTGLSAADTLQLTVRIGDKDLLALVDTGSTHMFIHEDIVTRLGLNITPRPGVCQASTLIIKGEIFSVDCYALPLQGFDIILGVHWLKTLGPIIWDFEALIMAFWRDDCAVRWTGIGGSPFHLRTLVTSSQLIDALLADYTDIFEEPQSLPPPRRHDHRIHLLPDTSPVAVRPYRYPQLLKDEIEKQCDAMLQQGIIRESTSPFSSPVLLVRKADNSWRFCVDYRALNDKTVKDKFPIPIVDELLDELKSARFFTKIDLWSGYHQVRMFLGQMWKRLRSARIKAILSSSSCPSD